MSDLMTENDLKTLVATILQEATDQGATSAEVDVGVNKGFSVTARQGDVESIEYHQDKAISITIYKGHRSGASSLSDSRPEAIRSAVQAACHIAQFTDEDPFSGLAKKEQLAWDYPTLDLACPWDMTVERAIEETKACEALALAHDKRLSSDGTTLSTASGWSAYGNTHGFIGAFPATRHDVSCMLIATHKDEMQRDYSYTVSCDPDHLSSIRDVAHEAARRTLRRLGATSLSTRQVPVIFAAEEARGLLGHFLAAISGRNLYKKSSFLLDQLGQSIFPQSISLDERPHLPRSLGSSPFDNDGVATRNQFFVENGLLKSYLLSVYSAKKLERSTTGNAGGAHNVFITTGQRSLPELLKHMGTGLLVTELMGQGVNIITGDYSRGASGFWIENGEIQHAVEEVTIAGNLREMYANIIEVGNDIDVRGNIRTGSILIDNMMVAGG